MAWQERDYYREEPTRWSASSVTLWLITINCLVVIADAILGTSRVLGSWAGPGQWMYFSFDKAITQLQIWRFFTYQFVQGGFLDLVLNMVGLYFFGPYIEHWWGSRKFLAFYLLCGMSGAVLFSLLTLAPHAVAVRPEAPLFGALGAIFGILVACAVLFPKMTVIPLIPPIPMTMRAMVLMFLGMAILVVLLGSLDPVAMAAHLCGAAMGFLLVKQPWLLGFADSMSFGFVRKMRQKARRRRVEMRQRAVDDEQVEVDRILEKVRMRGLQSLSRAEKRSLQRATERQRQSG